MKETGGGFARWMNVERIGREPHSFDIQATEEECAALATSLGILGLERLQASGSLVRQSSNGQIALSGRVTATAVQACVVTLEPVPETIDEEFTVFYTFDPKDLVVEDLDKVVGMDEPDLPELIVGGRINLADMIAEQIVLALDPYPRSENAPEDLSDAEALDRAKKEQGVYQPFANLKDLMSKK
ncbi:hypothetical protein GQF03_04090 [Sneathiella chungangensis]|uniref:DUF177 domain-containing protein n=1 Tax=Sneathiella chungangensis TaxID=1418234 RepID=A0A845MCV8_9PROT|nr:DUF177 domain-containing protein [Sneathiella chungangensis]MZR21501.1 hypothetical protein [Sneathiella chungangensis]